MYNRLTRAMSIAAGAVFIVIVAAGAARFRSTAAAVPCDPDNAGLTLPAGFCATIFADRIGAPRHMVVAANGDVLVVGNPYRGTDSAGTRQPGSLMLLRDANGDGKAELVKKLAPASGSGIALANGYVYTSLGTNIVRYRFVTGATEVGAPDTVLSGILTGGHSAYNFVIVGTTLYMNVGSRTNACQPVDQDRKGKAPGVDPCVELETRAGIWAFDANKLGQKPTDGQRFATGMRNSVSLTVNPRDRTLWATMHGRDQLSDWGFSTEYNANNPAEQTNHILKGDDFGWPYCYWSNEEKKLVTAPEYGGDGKQSTRCVGKKQPAFASPGHMAPNDMLFYAGTQFPAEYRSGAFIAFHGSWNRAPLPQAGFNVTYLALKGDKGTASSVFADGFSVAGAAGRDGRLHRPTGLAMGRDGSVYVSDDVAGTIYKISYRGK